MQDAVLNLCRVKMRDQQRLDSVGYLEEYPQYPHEMEAFKDKWCRAAATPAAAASRAGS